MKTFLAAMVATILLGLASVAAAQITPKLVSFETGGLTFNWQQGTGGPATEFRTKCGSVQGGPYSTVAAFPIGGFPAGPSYRVQYANFLTGPGKWFCVVTAANVQTGGTLESGPSNEAAGDVQKGPVTGQNVAFE